MSTEITIAVVAAVSSLLVALVSLVSARSNARQIADSAREIEQLKFEHARKEAELGLRDNELNSSLEALQLLISSIQRVKDTISLALHYLATENADREKILEIAQDARIAMFSRYEEQLPYINHEEADIAHKAKNASLLVEMSISRLLEEPSGAKEEIDQERSSLLEERTLLTDYQNLLRDNRLVRLTGGIATQPPGEATIARSHSNSKD